MNPISQEYARHRRGFRETIVEIGYAGLSLEPLEGIAKAQLGYGDSPSGAVRDWKTSWIVVGHESLCGDPVFIDSEASGVPVYTAAHGEGAWKPLKVAPSSESFFEIVRKLAVLAKGRESPVKMRANPISQAERREFLSFVGNYFNRGIPEFWASMLEGDSWCFQLTNHRIRRLPQARLVQGTSRAIVNADHFNVRRHKDMEWYERSAEPLKSSIYHRAADYAVFALAAAILGDLVASRFILVGTNLLVSGIIIVVILSAVPAGIVALCGIRKFGRGKLLWKGIVGVVVPILLGCGWVWAIHRLHEVAEQLKHQSWIRRTNQRIRRFPQACLVRSTSHAIVNADQFNVRKQTVSVLRRIFAGIQRPLALMVIVAIPVWALWYLLSLVWPVYDLAMTLESPGGRYELVVLRGDAAAFDDFSYHIYVFPRDSAPKNLVPRTRIYMKGEWRGSEYLIYSGYSYPEFRWTSANSIEIDADDYYPEVNRFCPVKRFGVDKAIRVSLVFGGKSPLNHAPWI
jgi:hypothetical protein